MSAADLLAVLLAGQHFTSNGRSKARASQGWRTRTTGRKANGEARTAVGAARDTDGRLVVVEAHWPESGL